MEKIPEVAKDNARTFLNEIGDYTSQLNKLGKRGQLTIRIPYGEEVLYENLPVGFDEVWSALLILGWDSSQISDCDSYVRVMII